MRRAGLAFALLVLAMPASASAYVIGGGSWPTHRITYFNADRAMGVPVAMAVHAWNTSGADVRFVRAGRARADVIIRKRRPPRAGAAVLQGLCGGYAEVGYTGRTEFVDLSPGCGGGVEYPAGVAAHELGHILGLDHPSGGCAAMTSTVWEFCKRPPHDWQYRCRLLQPDDVRGAITLYGGRLRHKRCDAFAPPAAPRNIMLDANHASVTWLNPALPDLAVPDVDTPKLRAYVALQRDTCPAASDYSKVSDTLVDARPGGYQSVSIPPQAGFGAGVWCVAVFIRDQYGRGSDASVNVTVPPSPIQVSFGVQPLDGRCATFSDASTDSDGHVIGWQWTFGDGTLDENTGTITHCFPMAGTYVVALTVFDDRGRNATGSQPFETASVPG